MNKRHLIIITLLIISTLFLGGCSNAQEGENLTAIQSQEAISNTSGLVVLDLRTPAEFTAGHIQGAVNIDYYNPSFKGELEKLNKETPYLIYCRSGNRSGKTYEFMKQAGFEKVFHLDGGTKAWTQAGLPLIR